MKTRTALLVIVLLWMASCMNHTLCPTYSSARGHSSTMTSSKKIKPSKNKKVSYKSMKQAEQD